MKKVSSEVTRMNRRDRIVLCGSGDEAETAAAWAEARARDARRSSAAAQRYGMRVRVAYEEACHLLVSRGGESPAIQITIAERDLTPRIDLVDAAAEAPRYRQAG